MGKQNYVTQEPHLFYSGPRPSSRTFLTHFLQTTPDVGARVADLGILSLLPLGPFSLQAVPFAIAPACPVLVASTTLLLGPLPCRPRPSPESITEATVGSQGLCEAEIEEAVLGHHVSQELRGRLAQVPFPEEVFLGDRRRLGSGPRQAAPASSIPTPAGTLPR